MTHEETVKIVRIAYASLSHGSVTQEELRDKVDAYEMFLGEYDYNEVSLALKALITSGKIRFVPSVSEIIDEINKLKSVSKRETDDNEMVAWSKVRSAIRNGTYNSESEFERLPALVQEVVGTPKQLYIWATDENFNESVVQSNFMRVYANELKKAKEIQMIPSDVLGIAQKMYGSDRLIEGD